HSFLSLHKAGDWYIPQPCLLTDFLCCQEPERRHDSLSLYRARSLRIQRAGRCCPSTSLKMQPLQLRIDFQLEEKPERTLLKVRPIIFHLNQTSVFSCL